MLKYLDAVQSASNDFIFKGGNLLWLYIKTPRATIDLDFVTKKLNTHLDVRDVLEKANKVYKEISFEIKEFRKINEGDREVGCAVIVSFETSLGQKNQFDLDIVYALETDTVQIKSTTSDANLIASSIENIVADKISASYQFKSGNTRMKDFDDLWRIAKVSKVDMKKLEDLLSKRKIPKQLDVNWIEYLQESWTVHSKSYKDLPKSLSRIFEDINQWLK